MKLDKEQFFIKLLSYNENIYKNEDNHNHYSVKMFDLINKFENVVNYRYKEFKTFFSADYLLKNGNEIQVTLTLKLQIQHVIYIENKGFPKEDEEEPF